MIPSDVPKENVQLDLEQPHVEILDTRDSSVWQVMHGMTRAEYDAISVEPPYVKVGIGVAAMDGAYFGDSFQGPVDAESWRS